MTRRVVLLLFGLVAMAGCRSPKDIVWSFATPRPWVLAGDSQTMMPAVEGDTVFFCGGYEEKESSQIYALDLETGKPK